MFHQTLVAYWVVYLSYLPLWGSAVPLLMITKQIHLTPVGVAHIERQFLGLHGP